MHGRVCRLQTQDEDVREAFCLKNEKSGATGGKGFQNAAQVFLPLYSIFLSLFLFFFPKFILSPTVENVKKAHQIKEEHSIAYNPSIEINMPPFIISPSWLCVAPFVVVFFIKHFDKMGNNHDTILYINI